MSFNRKLPTKISKGVIRPRAYFWQDDDFIVSEQVLFLMERFTLRASDGHQVACYLWPVTEPRAIIQIAHGMGEHAMRYARVARQLNAAGYVVYANDHRGHGETAGEHAGFMGLDGWNRTLADMYELNGRCRGLHPELKLCLLGHSMGSTLSQQYITQHGQSIDALVLSGSPGFKEQWVSFLGHWIIRFEGWRLEPWQSSTLMQKALFGKANAPFDGAKATGYEWLSRDHDEVMKYVEDDRCGFVLAIGSLKDMFRGGAAAQDPRGIEKIPAELPTYIFSGDEDPFHGERKDLHRMVEAYRRRGMQKLDYRYYNGGRHEMLNEINREEVVADLIEWLNDNLNGAL